MVIAVRNLAVIDLGFEPHPWHQNVRNFIFVQFIELDQILVDVCLISHCEAAACTTDQCLFASMWTTMANLPCLLSRGQQVLHHRWIWGFCFMQVTKHASEGIHSGFDNQSRRNQKSKTGVLVDPQKRAGLLQICFKRKNPNWRDFLLLGTWIVRLIKWRIALPDNCPRTWWKKWKK